jgi:2-polyprenyl-6-methoxyphenol hydroxylase-like FAD-dependent oxidoreductase
METTDVLVVGAGPTGLMLATELALAGARCRVLDRRTDAPNTTRAFAVHARTPELLDARGMADELLPRGIPVREIAPAPGAVIDLGALDSRFPMILIAPQSGTEHVLERRARDLGVEIDRGAEVVGLRQDAQRVVVELEGGGAETAQYVVGCDGTARCASCSASRSPAPSTRPTSCSPTSASPRRRRRRCSPRPARRAR